MRRLKKNLVIVVVFCSFLFAYTPKIYALTCQQVRQLTAVYLKMHYSFNHFDAELSKRTLDLFIKTWDPGKLFFYQSDVDDLTNKYSTQIGDMIHNADCKIVTDVVNLFSKRFDERNKDISKLIEGKQDFKIDEYLEFDRKKTGWATTSEELVERWRKRVKFQMLQLKDTLQDLDKARKKLHKRYELAVKRHNEETLDNAYEKLLNAFALGLDPHSEYMSSEQLEDFHIATKLSLEGIGALLRSDDGFTTIQSLVPGGAAAKTGKLKVDDKIIAVAQGTDTPVDVIDMDLREVVKMIRGPGGTEVRLTIVRDTTGKTVQLVVPVTREKIELTDRTAQSKVIPVNVKEPSGAKRTLNIGFLNLPSFYVDFEGQHQKESDFRSSANDVLEELKKLNDKKIDALVLDLRNNGGGSLTESIKIAGFFFDKGPVVQIKESDENVFPHSDEDGITYYNGPLVVMVSRQSASASEIFAGCIQDYGRGLLVGDSHTFGKGTVQNLNDIGMGTKLGATKVTISKFYRPSGSSTQLKGVESDIVLPSFSEELEIGEKYYDYALPWDQIKPVAHQEFNLVKPFVTPLAKNSKERIAKDSGFKQILTELDEYKKKKDERSRVSLKEETKEEKEKKEKEKKDKSVSKADEDETGDYSEVPLEDDVYLQESLKIAADYAQLIQKRKTGELTLPTLKKKPATIAKDKKKEKENVKADEKKVSPTPSVKPEEKK